SDRGGASVGGLFGDSACSWRSGSALPDHRRLIASSGDRPRFPDSKWTTRAVLSAASVPAMVAASALVPGMTEMVPAAGAVSAAARPAVHQRRDGVGERPGSAGQGY